MAKRYVEECDFCKKESELDYILLLKPSKGKKSGRGYDICSTCKEAIEKMLVSAQGAGKLLTENRIEKSDASRNSIRSQEDENTITLPDGTKRNIPSREDIARGSESNPGTFLENDSDECLHMNRSRPRISRETNQVMVECRDCHKPLPYKSARQKAQELNAKLPDGTSLTTHASEDRVRE